MTIRRIGFFSRLLEDVPAAQRYQLVTEQIQKAEQLGFDSAWLAQHHFNGQEGGLPSPLVLLAHIAAQTQRIRLGTGIITLALEQPVRIAEDSSVLDQLSHGRLELGVGSGGTPSSFAPFGLAFDERREAFSHHLESLVQALEGHPIAATDNRLYPAAPSLSQRLWVATFSPQGAAQAGAGGHGLLLSRTQPRPSGQAGMHLDEIQTPIIDAYLAALPADVAPRILASRTLLVADTNAAARTIAEPGIRDQAQRYQQAGNELRGHQLDDLLGQFDAHVGNPDTALTSLLEDSAMRRATDIAFQVHSTRPTPEQTLRSLELTAAHLAPVLRTASVTAEN